MCRTPRHQQEYEDMCDVTEREIGLDTSRTGRGGARVLENALVPKVIRRGCDCVAQQLDTAKPATYGTLLSRISFMGGLISFQPRTSP